MLNKVGIPGYAIFIVISGLFCILPLATFILIPKDDIFMRKKIHGKVSWFHCTRGASISFDTTAIIGLELIHVFAKGN